MLTSQLWCRTQFTCGCLAVLLAPALPLAHSGPHCRHAAMEGRNER